MIGKAAGRFENLLTILALKIMMFFNVTLQLILRIGNVFAIRTRDDVIGFGVLKICQLCLKSFFANCTFVFVIRLMMLSQLGLGMELFFAIFTDEIHLLKSRGYFLLFLCFPQL